MSDAIRFEFAASIDERGGFVPVQATTRATLAKWRKHGVLTVTVQRYRKPKSLPQLGYYYTAVLPAFAEHVGSDADTTHTDLKSHFFPKRRETSKLTGEQYDEAPSLADATEEEMSEFLDRIIRYAAGIGLPIAPPKGSPEWATWASL